MSNERPTKRRRAFSGSDWDLGLPIPPRLLIKKHSEKGRVPTRGSTLAAGYDLYSAEKKVIPARGKALVDTQISIAVPVGTYGRVAPRSGLAVRSGIDTGAGVIDGDYRGIVHILLFNLGENDFEIDEGDRIAQLVIERIFTPEISVVDDLGETIRGTAAFGSTGGHSSLSSTASSSESD